MTPGADVNIFRQHVSSFQDVEEGFCFYQDMTSEAAFAVKHTEGEITLVSQFSDENLEVRYLKISSEKKTWVCIHAHAVEIKRKVLFPFQEGRFTSEGTSYYLRPANETGHLYTIEDIGQSK